MSEKSFDLEKFASGALSERINSEVIKVAENIADPNTDAKKKRKLIVTLTFSPGGDRQLVGLQVETKTTLVSNEGFKTNMIIDKDLKTQKVQAKEWGKEIVGQLSTEEIETADNSEKDENQVTNIIDLRQKNK